MTFIEVLLIGIGLSMDAFAVALSKGLSMKKLNIRYGVLIAVFFGFFQAFMPLIGWLVCRSFEKYITRVDHWIVFVLLGFIGIKMIVDAIKDRNKEEKDSEREQIRIGELFILAIATSIDALAVGISFAFLSINIWSSITIIGITTLILSFLGVLIGNKFGAKYQTKAQIAGGIILILVGLKILLEHLGVINF
ncbi:MAG: manganese efflux pump [Lachnospiraceae bacterium]|nr:manganese efflux pump [Lachnospiraceae bacterium]